MRVFPVQRANNFSEFRFVSAQTWARIPLGRPAGMVFLCLTFTIYPFTGSNELLPPATQHNATFRTGTGSAVQLYANETEYEYTRPLNTLATCVLCFMRKLKKWFITMCTTNTRAILILLLHATTAITLRLHPTNTDSRLRLRLFCVSCYCVKQHLQW